MVRLADQLPDVLRRHGADPAVWIEDKRLSLVVHGRKAADPEGVLDPLRDPVAELADELDLEVHPGNGVIEVRLPGFDKAGVLRRLVDDRGLPWRAVRAATTSATSRRSRRSAGSGPTAARRTASPSRPAACADAVAAADLSVPTPPTHLRRRCCAAI